MTAQPRKSTNLSMDISLIAEAKSLNVNLSRAAEDGLRQAVRKARTAQWREQNAAALAASNTWVEERGLPLERHRLF